MSPTDGSGGGGGHASGIDIDTEAERCGSGTLEREGVEVDKAGTEAESEMMEASLLVGDKRPGGWSFWRNF